MEKEARKGKRRGSKEKVATWTTRSQTGHIPRFFHGENVPGVDSNDSILKLRHKMIQVGGEDRFGFAAAVRQKNTETILVLRQISWFRLVLVIEDVEDLEIGLECVL
jgi:hypothetical protein